MIQLSLCAYFFFPNPHSYPQESERHVLESTSEQSENQVSMLRIVALEVF